MKKENIWLFAFLGVLILLSVFSMQTNFHDTPEYINIAKNFAGVKNIDIYSTHSLLYPAIVAPLLKIFPSIIMIKIVNCFWLLLIGFAMLFLLKDNRAFIIFAFSPLVWLVSIQTTPVLPATFFFFLAWIFLKKEQLAHNKIFSGLFLGLACGFYDVLIPIAVIFTLIYFYDKRFSSVIFYTVMIGIGFLPRLILDFWLFGNPIYSLIRFAGANFAVSAALNPHGGNFGLLANPEFILIVIAISPLAYTLYRLSFREHKREIFLSIILVLMFLVRGGKLKYFFILAPILIVLIAKNLRLKEIKWNVFLSAILILAVVTNFVIYKYDSKVQSDLNKIIQENNPNFLIAGPYEANYFATYLWQDKPYVFWFEDYQASLQNKTVIREYNFELNSNKIRLRDRVIISGAFERIDNKTYEKGIIVSQNSNLTGFNLRKCYEVLCVYDSK